MNQIKVIKRADRTALAVSSVAPKKTQMTQKSYDSNESKKRQKAAGVVAGWVGEWRERQTRRNPKQIFAELFRSDPATDRTR